MLTLVVKSSTRPRAAKAAKINKSQHYAKVNSSPALQMGCDALLDVAGKGTLSKWRDTPLGPRRIGDGDLVYAK